MSATRRKREPKRCKVCKRPEQKSVGGLYTNLAPYSGICVDCMNAAFDREDKARAKVMAKYGERERG